MRCGYVSAFALAFLLATGWTAPASGQEPLPAPPITLEVLLTVGPGLSPIARGSMIAAATDIWRLENVVLTWLPAGVARKSPPLSLRLLVLPRGRPTASDENATVVVGELLRPDNSLPVAVASIEIAERIVREDGRRPTLTTQLDQYCVGLVLGRAVAHEIGHFLLSSSTHARKGLMRARFDMREFTDPGSTAFFLDRETALGLTARIDRSARTTAVTPLREAVGVSPSP